MTDTKAAKTMQRKPENPISDELPDEMPSQLCGKDVQSLAGLVGAGLNNSRRN